MIDYFTMDGCPGLYFNCPRNLGKFAVAHCVRMYSEAHTPKGWAQGVRWTCRNCPTGADHAQVAPPPPSRFARSLRCTRCHRSANRLIRGVICLSCYNREREVLIGRNRKGNPPKFCPPIIACQVAVVGEVGTEVVKVERVASRVEAVLTLLRDHPARAFGWSGK